MNIIKPYIPRIDLEEILRASAKKIEANQERASGRKTPEIITQNIDGFFYVPSIRLYLAKERSLNNENWNSAIDKIYNQGIIITEQRAEMPTPFEFMTGLIYVLDNEAIPDLAKEERTKFLNDVLGLKNTYRGNYLNARFEGNAVETAITKNGKLDWKKEPLDNCLQKYCYADLRKINSQGLFTTESIKQEYIKGETAYFWKPVDGAVAGFDAVLDRAYFICGRYPGYSDAALGVRLVVRPKGVSQKILEIK